MWACYLGVVKVCAVGNAVQKPGIASSRSTVRLEGMRFSTKNTKTYSRIKNNCIIWVNNMNRIEKLVKKIKSKTHKETSHYWVIWTLWINSNVCKIYKYICIPGVMKFDSMIWRTSWTISITVITKWYYATNHIE